MDLVDLATRFVADRRRRNPDDSDPELEPAVVANEFCAYVQAEAGEISAWSDEVWSKALQRAGVPEPFVADAIETAGSWGMVDDIG